MAKTKGYGPTGRDMRAEAKSYQNALVKMAEPSSKRGFLAAKWFIRIVVIGIVVFTVVNFLLASQNNRLNRDLEATLTTQYNPAYRVRFADIGGEVIKAWYQGAPSPVTVPEDISWGSGSLGLASESTSVAVGNPDYVPSQKPPLKVTGVTFLKGVQDSLTTGESNAYQENLTYYALINSVPYNINIVLGLNDLDDRAGMPVLLSIPTVLPADQATEDQAGNITLEPDIGYKDIEITDDLTVQADKWAKAWTTGDSVALKQMTKDETARKYIGLNGGWEFVADSLVVDWAKYNDPDYGFAQVTWTMKIPDKVIPAENISEPPTVIPGPTQEQSMTLMLTEYDTALPGVVAWGPPGSYSVLEAYGNALPEDAPEDLAPTTAPTPTPTPSISSTPGKSKKKN